MNRLEIFLQTYGLWALFFAAAIEGDLTLLLTGLLVRLNIWPLWKAWSIGALGALCGDSFYFWLGHGTARRWLTTAHGQRLMPGIERAAKRYGVRSLFFARYLYGARMVTVFFWGMQRISPWKFLGLDAVNCAIWATVFGGIGYVFSSTLESIIGKLRHVEHWLLIGVAVFAALLALRYWLAEIARMREEVLKNGNGQLEKRQK